MAAPTKTITWDNLNTSTTYNFDSMLKDAIFNKHILLNKFNEKKKTYDGGVFITEPIMKDRGNGKSYDNMEVLTPLNKEFMETAVFNPAHYEVDITMSYTDDLANRGSARIVDLMEAKYENAKMTMEYLLTTALYGDGTIATYGSAPIVGLGAAVSTTPTADPTPGAYGGITRVSQSFWQNQINDQTAGSELNITLLDVQNLWSLCSDANEHPDVIVTTDALWNQAWDLADDKQRLGNEAAAKQGYTSIDFNGVPMVVDKACTEHYMYLLNTDYMYLKVHQDDDMAATPFLQGTTQLVQVKYITWTGQLVCSNPRRQGVLWTT